MRPSLLRSCGVSLLLLGIVGCGDDGGKATQDGGAGHAGGNGGKSGKGGGGGQGAVAGGGGAAGEATGTAGAAGAGTAGAAGAGTAGAAGGTAKDAGTGLDLGGVVPPASLTATVKNRRETLFELIWTAPSINGAAVTSYQVRYAKVPITAANFDDTTVTTVIPNTNTPKPPGMTDGMDVKLYIENAYYFAVEGEITGGTRSAIDATTTPVAAHFEVTTVPSTSGTNEQFGHSVSAEADVNGDGLSDLVVGTSNAGRAYLFLGSNDFSPTAPSVTFSGSTNGFGFLAAEIGDIDNDGLEDIAISDPLSAEKVFIYRGRQSWPLTLTDAQADYVVSTDASYVGSGFGSSLARLGDFTGDGIDDFAIGARVFSTGKGRIIIVPGKASGFGSIALPNVNDAIVIDADTTLDQSYLGYKVLGLGHFYPISSGTTLVASAPGSTTSANTAGRVYAFHGQTGTAGAIAIGSADNVLNGPGNGARIGIVLTNLQTMLNGFPAVGAGNLQDAIDIPGGHGGAYLAKGSPVTGPFSSITVAYQSGASAGGGVLLGGGVSGRDGKLSLIGDSNPDLVFAGEISSQLTISDGSKIGSRTSPIEVNSTADVVIALPSGWSSGEGSDSMIGDINGDGVPDFCIGSQLQPGAVLVFW